MKKILFISWDGPQTTYMEGLFMPIFKEIGDKEPVSFHVIQFTWGDKERISQTEVAAAQLGITYVSFPVSRKPFVSTGSLITLIKGVSFLNKYIKDNEIEIVMPRSTLPSIMVNRIKKNNFKILFDADGLAIEERVDFAGLSKNSLMYRFFKAEETKMLKSADAVITRSQKAIDFHLQNIGKEYKDKFSVVYNGRNVDFFKPDSAIRLKMRETLGIRKNDKVFIYCGSLGPQYGWKEMTAIFSKYHEGNQQSKFLILTGDQEYAFQNLPIELKSNVIIKKVAFAEVPYYLNIADFAFAIREPKLSMQGVAPIKLGEYLLMGLPTIASAGIGDTESILKEAPNCLLFYHDKNNQVEKIVDSLDKATAGNQEKIRYIGEKYFSLQRSAESYIYAFKIILN